MNYTQKTDYPSIPDAQLASVVMAELQWHYEQDCIVKGKYWENGKGCAVGCLLKGSNHIEYEKSFGIPVMLAHLEDGMFEGLPKSDAALFPLDFMGACMTVGKTRKQRMKKLNVVGWQLFHWVLTEELPKTIIGNGDVYDNVRKAIAQCADVLVPLTKGKKVNKKQARAAVHTARAARVARVARAARVAAYAARVAAYAAVPASADAANAAARVAAYKRMADKLIELIKLAGVNTYNPELKLNLSEVMEQ